MEATQPIQRGCHVICVGFDHADQLRAVCPTLSHDTLTEIENATATGFSNASLLRIVRGIARRDGLSGIALVWNQSPFPKPPGSLAGEYYVTPPPPLGLVFEPVELNETDRRLAELLDESCSSISRGGVPRLPARRPYASMPGVLIAMGAIALLILAWVTPVPCCMLLLCIPLVIVLTRLPKFGSPAWFLVPGGVLVRRAGLGRASVRLSVHCPGETILVAHPRPPGWTVRLIGSKTHTRFLTQLEFRALLRVWQSGLDMPKSFDDLQ